MNAPEALTKLTPHPGNLNRDAILFAAGRASAPQVWPWKTLAVVLLWTQLITIAVFAWPSSNTVVQPEPRIPPASDSAPVPDSPQVIDPNSYAAYLRRNWEFEAATPIGVSEPSPKPWRVWDAPVKGDF